MEAVEIEVVVRSNTFGHVLLLWGTSNLRASSLGVEAWRKSFQKWRVYSLTRMSTKLSDAGQASYLVCPLHPMFRVNIEQVFMSSHDCYSIWTSSDCTFDHYFGALISCSRNSLAQETPCLSNVLWTYPTDSTEEPSDDVSWTFQAAHLKPFLEERDAKAAAEQAKVAAQEAERLADEQAERDRVEQEAERQRWEEQERRRQEEERKRGEDERRRVEEERRRQVGNLITGNLITGELLT
jgi:hypothetical protein